jgi:hypothetical protein
MKLVPSHTIPFRSAGGQDSRPETWIEVRFHETGIINLELRAQGNRLVKLQSVLVRQVELEKGHDRPG